MATRGKGSDFNVDTILTELGSCGLFHIRMYVLLLIPVVLFSMYDMTYLFTTARLDYRCIVPECDETAPNYKTEWLSAAIPNSIDGKPMQCERFAPIEGSSGQCDSTMFNQSQIIQCEEFVFDTIEVNVINEFNVTCPENEWILSSIGSVAYIADFIILPLHGFLSDRYGRRVLIIVALITICTLGIAKSYAFSLSTYIILKFFTALLTTGSFTTLLIMILEWVAPKNREVASTLTCIAYSFGQIGLGLIASVMNDFRHLLRWLYYPSFIVLAYIWVIPESLRWMYNKRQHERLKRTIENAAKLNNVTLSVETIQELGQSIEMGNEITNTENKKLGHTIFTSSKLFYRLLICVYCMFVQSAIYNGLNVHSQSISGSKFFNYITVNIADIPGNIMGYFVMTRLGRRLPMSFSLLATAVLCVLSEILPVFNDQYAEVIRLVICIMCKLAVTVACSIAAIYNSELFPTELRQSFMNSCYAMSCVGSMLAPHVRLLDVFMPHVTMILFAVISTTAGALIFLLPETFAESLPDTIEEAENVGRRTKSLTQF